MAITNIPFGNVQLIQSVYHNLVLINQQIVDSTAEYQACSTLLSGFCPFHPIKIV